MKMTYCPNWSGHVAHIICRLQLCIMAAYSAVRAAAFAQPHGNDMKIIWLVANVNTNKPLVCTVVT